MHSLKLVCILAKQIRNKMKNLIYLESVGSYLITNKYKVCPANEDNTPDLENSISIDAISNEWYNSLSIKDKHFINTTPRY